MNSRSPVKYCFIVAALIVTFASDAQSQFAAGRWHVQTTSGDQPAQLASGDPVMFDAAFDCLTEACSGREISTYDSSICDTVRFENISSGLSINGTNAAFQFAVSAGNDGFFIYTFLGTIAETYITISGVNSIASATITGTYGSTAGGCNNGTAGDQGTFVAHWYPLITGTYVGHLIPAKKTMPSFGAELVLSQGDYGALTGTITTGQEVLNPRTGIITFEPIKNACFSTISLTTVQDPSIDTNDASGRLFFVYAKDGAGTSLSLSGVANEIGSNSAYTVDYEIVGGPCSGQTGTNALFRPITISRSVFPRPIPGPRLPGAVR
jgi:hypothetical protein